MRRQRANSILGDGGLGVLVAKNKQKAHCWGSADVPAIVNSCHVFIMNKMDVSTEIRTFGVEAGADVHLPYTLRSGDPLTSCCIHVPKMGFLQKITDVR